MESLHRQTTMVVSVFLRIKEFCVNFHTYFKENIKCQKDKCYSGKAVIKRLFYNSSPAVKNLTTYKKENNLRSKEEQYLTVSFQDWNSNLR